MKKILTLACVAALSLAAHAQKNTAAIGVSGSYGLDMKSFGLGAKAQYGFTKEIRGEASFNWFFEDKGFTHWDVNLNAHYLFPLKSGFTVYPLAGLTYVQVGVTESTVNGLINVINDNFGTQISHSSSSATEGLLGANFGVGVEKQFGKDWKANVELKYQMVKGYGQFVPSIGVAYTF